MDSDDWAEHLEVVAPLGVDERGRVANRATIEFVCPECLMAYDIEITMPMQVPNA